MPKSLGGNDSMDNLAAMCAPHNLRKGAKVVERKNYLNANYFNVGTRANG